MNKRVVLASAFILAAGSAHASGWRIPEQSVNATARSGGYVAHTPGADAAYYNPANLSWQEDRGLLELAATWIHLGSISYSDNRTPAFDGASEKENFLLPTFFAVSPEYGDFRVGLALTAPAGLSKQWKQPFPRTTAEEFTLEVFELNPTLSYRFCEQFSVAAGLRVLYADGKVKSSGMIPGGYTVSRDMDGDSWEGGFNLAMSARPMEALSLAVTYRSKVDLGVSGHAELATSAGPASYSGDAEVSIPVPAVLSLAAAYTFFEQLTVELEYERTYWSEYEQLDFNYPVPLGNPVLSAAFDRPLARNWSDTDTYRISLEYDCQNDLILMAGFAIDENPAPDAHLGFELPDSDAKLYSLGLRYRVNQDLELGLAYLYDDKESRAGTNDIIDGNFDDALAHLVTVGLSWKL